MRLPRPTATSTAAFLVIGLRRFSDHWNPVIAFSGKIDSSYSPGFRSWPHRAAMHTSSRQANARLVLLAPPQLKQCIVPATHADAG